jgi:hypothetical protein
VREVEVQRHFAAPRECVFAERPFRSGPDGLARRPTPEVPA